MRTQLCIRRLWIFISTARASHEKYLFICKFSSIWTDLATSMRRKNHCTTEHTQFCNSNLHSCISSPISTFNKFLMSLNLVELDWLAKRHVMILELVNQLEEIYKRTKKWNAGPLGLISTDEAFLFLCFYNLNKTKVSWLEQTLFFEQLLNKKSHMYISPHKKFSLILILSKNNSWNPKGTDHEKK